LKNCSYNVPSCKPFVQQTFSPPVLTFLLLMAQAFGDFSLQPHLSIIVRIPEQCGFLGKNYKAVIQDIKYISRF
jgi:hypothetical protein